MVWKETEVSCHITHRGSSMSEKPYSPTVLKGSTSHPHRPCGLTAHGPYLPGGMDASSGSLSFTFSPAVPREKPGPTWRRRGGRRESARRRGSPCVRRRRGLRVATPCWPPCASCATATLSGASWCTTMCGQSSTTRTSDRAPASGTSSATTSGESGWRTTRATSPTDPCASSPSSKLVLFSSHITGSSRNEHFKLVLVLTRSEDPVVGIYTDAQLRLTSSSCSPMEKSSERLIISTNMYP